MATDINKVILVGRLTREPEYKNVNGTSLVKYSLATNRTYVVNGDKREDVSYVDCESWGKLADIIRQYCTKGKQILIEGRLKQDTWEAEGKKMSKLKVVVENMQLLGSKSDSSSQNSGPGPEDYPQTPSYNTPSHTGQQSPGDNYPPRPTSTFSEYGPEINDEEPF